MPTAINLPQLGESVTEGTITRWLKEVGDTIEVDEPLLEVSTDKVDTEIPSPVAGVLLSIAAQEDDVVEVGGLLAEVGDPSEAPTSAPPAAPAAPAAAPAPPAAPTPPAPPAPAAPAAPAPAAPEPAAAAAPADAVDVILPELGESVTEGTVTRWLKQPGDTVEVDEPLLEISTDKVDTEIPSPVAGFLAEIVVPEDEDVEVGGVLARISSSPPASQAGTPPAPAPEEPAAEPATPPAPAAEPSPPAAPVAPAATPAPAPAPKADSGPAYVTPLVRKLAKEHNIDISRVAGTGVGGRIRRQDIDDAIARAAQPVAEPAAPVAPAAPAAPAATSATEPAGGTSEAAVPGQDRTEKMTRLRRVIAERMAESLQVSAQLTTVVEVDVTRIAHLRDRVKNDFLQREGVKLSFLPFFLKAVVEALKVYPVVNCSIDAEAGTITYHGAEHLGVAVDTDRGLLVPVIRDAGDLNIAGLSRRVADLAERTRTNKVTPDELSGGTFTLTNTGSRGALFDTPIINQPQVAILGTGAVVKRPVVVKGPDGGDVIAIRSMVYLALTYDHRIVDGADAARFLGSVKQRLETGAFEGELGV